MAPRSVKVMPVDIGGLLNGSKKKNQKKQNSDYLDNVVADIFPCIYNAEPHRDPSLVGGGDAPSLRRGRNDESIAIKFRLFVIQNTSVY